MNINAELLKSKAKKVKKKDLIILGVLIFSSIFMRAFFSKEKSNMNQLLGIKPMKRIPVEEIKNEEKERVMESIKNNVEDNYGVGRDIFFSNSSLEKIAPNLMGVTIGKKKSAMFTDGNIYQIGDDFYGSTIKSIGRNRVVIQDELGDLKILQVRRTQNEAN